jgi:hypothetical protein
MPSTPKIICPVGLVISSDKTYCEEEPVIVNGFSCPTFEPGDPNQTEYVLYKEKCYAPTEIITAPDKIATYNDDSTVKGKECPTINNNGSNYVVGDDVGDNSHCCPSNTIYDSSTNRCLATPTYYSSLKENQTRDGNYPDFFAYYQKNN